MPFRKELQGLLLGSQHYTRRAGIVTSKPEKPTENLKTPLRAHALMLHVCVGQRLLSLYLVFF